jgi:hypothetical protein
LRAAARLRALPGRRNPSTRPDAAPHPTPNLLPPQPPFSAHAPTARRAAAGLPFQAYCCTASGLAKLRAAAFADGLRYRGPRTGECGATEGGLLCDDLHRASYGHVLVDPGVQVAPEAAAAAALRAWQQREAARAEGERDADAAAEGGRRRAAAARRALREEQRWQQQHARKQRRPRQAAAANASAPAPARGPAGRWHARLAAWAPWWAVEAEAAREGYWLLDRINASRVECCDLASRGVELGPDGRAQGGGGGARGDKDDALDAAACAFWNVSALALPPLAPPARGGGGGVPGAAPAGGAGRRLVARPPWPRSP